MQEDRYLIVKGIAGLGDRLMTLGKALQLASLTGRTLVIDWSHDSWNHDDPPKGFWHYFDLSGLPRSVRVLRGDAETYALLDKLTAIQADTLPLQFQGAQRRSDCYLDHATQRLFMDSCNIQLTDREITASAHSVVVYIGYCTGQLKNTMRFLKIKQNNTDKPYDIGVHFRNTDRINDINIVLQKVVAIWKEGMIIYLATDDRSAIHVFQEKFGDCVHFTVPPPRPSNGGGIHYSSPDELRAVGLTKEDLNNLALQDIIRLCNSSVFIGCPNSFFTRIVETVRST
jgi:hypothetical protein